MSHVMQSGLGLGLVLPCYLPYGNAVFIVLLVTQN